MSVGKIVKNQCIDCEKKTNHKVLHEERESHRDDYDCDIEYQIVECCGCDLKSFRIITYDIEQAYPSEFGDEWNVPEYIQNYPKSIMWHKQFNNGNIPEIVKNIYDEVLEAIKEGALTLAGLGLRGTLESICNDLGVKGGNLEKRIDKLSTKGYISKKDAERLHGIRFLGNDAAHEIKKPKLPSIKVAVDIIEHLIRSVYILESESSGKLDTVVSDYEEFEKLINAVLKNYTKGSEVPVAKLLGKDSRRIKSVRKDLEQKLIEKIKNGEYKSLKIGKVDKYHGSPEKLQHFIIQ